MTLAEKILALRKRNQWSQEDLAEKLNVSRQSISKWESAAAVPDINRILELATLFGVTTDYLLKDDLEPAAQDTPATVTEADTRTRIAAEEARDFIQSKAYAGKQIALGTVLCILSPVLLILFSGLEDAGKMSEVLAYGAGIIVLLSMVSAAVAVFIISSSKMKRFHSLLQNDFILMDDAMEMVKAQRASFENPYLVKIITGIVLCIFSVIPLIIAGILESPDLLMIMLTAVLFVIVSAGVYLLITASTVKDSYCQLLQEETFDPAEKAEEKKVETFGSVYWPIVVAVYLGWSLTTNKWGITWIVWPVAALLFVGIVAALKGSHES